MFEYYLAVLKKYAVFSGRASRSEFWYFSLAGIIVCIIASGIISTFFDIYATVLFNNLYALLLIIPSLAVAVRRLHDIGKSGWVILIDLIPVVGFIWLIMLLAADSNQGDNKYGSRPKGLTAFSNSADKTIEIICLVISALAVFRLFLKSLFSL
jgi:uncharacterized membrane protein YhaH (DUF805 family)